MLNKTSIKFNNNVLETGVCGLFRAPMHLASQLMPSMRDLVDSAPIDNPEDYELDIKVHMLMVGQFPCIPNWHCDNVPRDESGLRFDLIRDDVPPMLLWISDGPETEFLSEPEEAVAVPSSHQETGRWINQAIDQGEIDTQFIEPNAWYSMDQRTPHRGNRATKAGWRVFARATHKSIAPARPVNSVIRRHAQVYLDAATFGW